MHSRAWQWSSVLPLMFMKPWAGVAEKALCHSIPGFQVNKLIGVLSMTCISIRGLQPAPWALSSGPGGEESHAIPRPALPP